MANFNSSSLGPPTPSTLAIADTGSTGHFLPADTPVLNKRPAIHPITIHNPNGTIMHSTHIAELNVPTLPLAARKAHIVPALHSLPLLSIGQLCDAGCQITLDADRMQVKHNDNIALTGLRNSESRLWHVDLAPTCPTTSDAGPTTTDQHVPTADQHCLGAIGSATPADLVAFAHASLFSPALPTLAKAIDKGFLTNFPGLTAKALRKYPPQSYAMVKGHLDQV